MKGRIDSQGRLSIGRPGLEKEYTQIQHCPWRSKIACGDWCPAFREPERETTRMAEHKIIDGKLVWQMGDRISYEGPYTGRTTLRLCA